jgi:hypothetical protein
VKTRRKPRLRVVSRPLDGKPRHRIAYQGDTRHWCVEVIPFADWKLLPLDARPDSARFLPSLESYVATFEITEEEAEDIKEELADAAVAWAFERCEEV